MSSTILANRELGRLLGKRRYDAGEPGAHVLWTLVGAGFTLSPWALFNEK